MDVFSGLDGVVEADPVTSTLKKRVPHVAKPRVSTSTRTPILNNGRYRKRPSTLIFSTILATLLFFSWMSYQEGCVEPKSVSKEYLYEKSSLSGEKEWFVSNVPLRGPTLLSATTKIATEFDGKYASITLDYDLNDDAVKVCAQSLNVLGMFSTQVFVIKKGFIQ